jgi:hypothetical protein
MCVAVVEILDVMSASSSSWKIEISIQII